VTWITLVLHHQVLFRRTRRGFVHAMLHARGDDESRREPARQKNQCKDEASRGHGSPNVDVLHVGHGLGTRNGQHAVAQVCDDAFRVDRHG